LKKNQNSHNWIKLSSISLVLLIVLSACSGTKTDTDSQLSGAAALQNSVRSEQDIAKQPQPAEVQARQLAKPGWPDPGAEGNQPSADTAGEGNLSPADPLPTVIPAGPAPAAPAVQVTADLSLAVGAQIGLRAPDFTLATLDGQMMRLSDLIGRPVVISYWATWCIPCKVELPILEQIYEEYQQQGLAVISVNATDQDTLEDVQSMVAELGMTYPVLLDSGKDFASSYGALFFPTTVFIDASGVIRHIQLGDSSEEKLRTQVKNLFAGGL
jgi:peroxiredoxin